MTDTAPTLRFYLDHDVSHDVCFELLGPAGHECWATGDAGRALAKDNEQAIYAHDRGAVLITHDREFSARRSENIFGQHIRLKCEQPDAVDVLSEHLVNLVGILSRHPDVYIELSRNRLTMQTTAGRNP